MLDYEFKPGKVEMAKNWLKGIDTNEMLDEAGKEAVDLARRYVPVRTGALKRSIDYTVNYDDRKLFVFADMDYAPYVELGTRKMNAQPFLRPAMEQALNSQKRRRD